jgi:hypothetical protein
MVLGRGHSSLLCVFGELGSDKDIASCSRVLGKSGRVRRVRDDAPISPAVTCRCRVATARCYAFALPPTRSFLAAVAAFPDGRCVLATGGR